MKLRDMAHTALYLNVWWDDYCFRTGCRAPVRNRRVWITNKSRFNAETIFSTEMRQN